VVTEVLVTVVAVVILFEVFEHVIIPLVAVCAGRGRQALTGSEGMVGKVVEVKRWSGREGTVSVDGEFWQATSRAPLEVGDEAIIVAVSDLTLRVEPSVGSFASDDGIAHG